MSISPRRTIIMNRVLILILAGLILLEPSDAASSEQQANHFCARGIAAEARGDLKAAANCYQLALRVNAGHKEAQAKVSALAKKLVPDGPLGIVIPNVTFKEATLSEALEFIRMKVDDISEGTSVIRFEFRKGEPKPGDGPGTSVLPPGTFPDVRITIAVNAIPVRECLRTIGGLAGVSFGQGKDTIVIYPTPKAAPATNPDVVALNPAQMAGQAMPATAAVNGITASDAAPSASHTSPEDIISALNDGQEPTSSTDSALRRFTWHPRNGTHEWVQYSFPRPQTIGGCAIYWFQDEPKVRLPHFWRVLYLDADGVWTPVSTRPELPSANAWNTVRFAPVQTTGLRIAAQLKNNGTAGILEWKVIPSKLLPSALTFSEIKLGDLIPLSSKVGYSKFRVNEYDGYEEKQGAKLLVGGVECTDFLFAHATSEVSYAVPSGFNRFTAVGISPSNRTNPVWTYQVLADGKSLFQSELLNTYPNREVKIDVELPPGTRTLTLIADNAGSSTADHSIWAEPKLHFPAASKEITARLAALDTHFQNLRTTRVEPGYAKAMQQLQATYLSAVLRAIEKAQRSADQAGFAALQGELRLLNAKQVVPEIDPPGVAAALATLRTAFRAGEKALRTQRLAQLGPIYDQHEAALETLAASQSGKAGDLAAIARARARLAEQRQGEAVAAHSAEGPSGAVPAEVPQA